MNSEIESEILQTIIERAPNSLREETILYDLSDYKPEEILGSLGNLVKQGKIIRKEHKVERAGVLVRTYMLSSYENIPIRRSIKIGDMLIPRMLDSDIGRAEDVNGSVEALSKYANSLEDRFVKMYREEMKSYWGGIITLFGIFVGLFSLIIVGSQKIIITENWSLGTVFLANFVQVAPLAVVLILFVVLLKFIFK